MSPEEKAQIAQAMRAARDKARGYADFFGWATDRDLEEWGVLTSLFESMEKDGALPYANLRIRGRGNDPPDCEGLNAEHQRVAIEVTELVDERAIKEFKAGTIYDSAEWNRENFLSMLSALLKKKDARFPNLKEPPYEGGYAVVVFTDEPGLPARDVLAYLEDHVFSGLKYITEALFLVSYDPCVNRCPYFRLRVGS